MTQQCCPAGARQREWVFGLEGRPREVVTVIWGLQAFKISTVFSERKSARERVPRGGWPGSHLLSLPLSSPPPPPPGSPPSATAAARRNRHSNWQWTQRHSDNCGWPLWQLQRVSIPSFQDSSSPICSSLCVWHLPLYPSLKLFSLFSLSLSFFSSPLDSPGFCEMLIRESVGG